MFFVLFVAKNGKMIILYTHTAMSSEAPPQPSLGRALKKSPFFMTKTENAYDL